jgi:phytoene/squalene synthetase
MHHTCHWPNCREEIPPKLLMCLHHWPLLPPPIRHAVWATYRLGQETDKNPSRAYMAAVRAALDWAEQYDERRRCRAYLAVTGWTVLLALVWEVIA